MSVSILYLILLLLLRPIQMHYHFLMMKYRHRLVIALASSGRGHPATLGPTLGLSPVKIESTRQSTTKARTISTPLTNSRFPRATLSASVSLSISLWALPAA